MSSFALGQPLEYRTGKVFSRLCLISLSFKSKVRIEIPGTDLVLHKIQPRHKALTIEQHKTKHRNANFTSDASITLFYLVNVLTINILCVCVFKSDENSFKSRGLGHH